MSPGWGAGAVAWWQRLAPQLDREALGAALLGHDTRRSTLVRVSMRRNGIMARSPQEQRLLCTMLIVDPVGDHLPMGERIALARVCCELPWPEVARCLRASVECTDRELDRWLAQAGATVAERLDVWGLAPA